DEQLSRGGRSSTLRFEQTRSGGHLLAAQEAQTVGLAAGRTAQLAAADHVMAVGQPQQLPFGDAEAVGLVLGPVSETLKLQRAVATDELQAEEVACVVAQTLLADTDAEDVAVALDRLQ